MSNDWAKWDAEHGHGGGSTTSAERIAAQIHGSLGHAGSGPTPKTSETRVKTSKSVVSRAADSRSSAQHVTKKAMKRPAPVKGQKNRYDSAQTTIRMAEYNRKKKMAVAGDPTDKLTPKTEINANPHVDAKKTSSVSKIVAAIKGVHAEHKALAPPLAAPAHEPGSLEDKASKAEAATKRASEAPTKANHEAAAAAHKEAATMYEADQAKAGVYHHEMASYHSHAASSPTTLIAATVGQEHKDEHASKFPNALHSMFSSFMDTVSRRRSQKMYDSVPKASETGLTQAHKASISAYTGSHYARINGHLRGTDPRVGTEKAAVEKHVTNLDAAFAKQPGLAHDLITYRGTHSADKLFGPIGSKVGGEFQDLGYGSTASHAAVTAGFGSSTGALIRIIHPQGSKLLKPSDVGSFGDAERELLTPRGTRYHVAADRMVTTKTGKQKRMIDLVRK